MLRRRRKYRFCRVDRSLGLGLRSFYSGLAAFLARLWLWLWLLLLLLSNRINTRSPFDGLFPENRRRVALFWTNNSESVRLSREDKRAVLAVTFSGQARKYSLTRASPNSQLALIISGKYSIFVQTAMRIGKVTQWTSEEDTDELLSTYLY